MHDQQDSAVPPTPHGNPVIILDYQKPEAYEPSDLGPPSEATRAFWRLCRGIGRVLGRIWRWIGGRSAQSRNSPGSNRI